ncbi:50S ribosomal protein L25 [Azospirillaceae bacterium]
MSDVIVLSAETRNRAGKGTARRTRVSGRLPAVIYGGKEKPLLISLEQRAFGRALHRPGFFTHLFDVEVDGKLHRVLPRDVQFDPVTDVPLHADFLRVAQDARLTIEVPVEFLHQDKSPGLKHGGVLNVVRFKIEVHCRADAIPEHIVVDLSGKEIGDSIHISHIALPDGVVPTIAERDFTIATIAAPTVKSDEAGAEAASEAAKA